jgi:solute carrier family 45 protein 1/2/4
VFKRHAEEFRHASLPHRAAAAVASVIKAVKTGSAWALPIKGLTLIKLWFFAQIIFCLCMLCTLFTSTVNGAYGVIATSGFAWALAQWAPFALLGELVLIDSPEGNRTEMRALAQAPASEVVFATEASNSATSPLQSRNPSRSHMRHVSHETITDESDRSRMNASAERIPRRETNASVDLEIDTTVVLRHSDEFSVASQDDILTPSPPDSARDPRPSTADKAGLILGIHNVFIVLPQFVITLLSSVIFAVMDDSGSGKAASAVSARSPAADGPSSPNAVAIVFRIGGAAAAVGAYLSYRLARRWKMSGPS